MYEIDVFDEFCAAHAVTIDGEREVMHGHNWQVLAVFAAAQTGPNDVLVDFRDARAWLDAALAPFRHTTLNDVPPFNEVNPTAERIAAYLASRLQASIDRADTDNRFGPCAGGLRVARVRVTESPGCAATFIPKGRGE